MSERTRGGEVHSKESASGPPLWRGRSAAGIAAVLLLGIGSLAFVRSPYFAADHLAVEGASRLARERVLELAGVVPGENVLTFDTAAAERRLEADPWIASALVRTDLPDTIVVRIAERTPVGTIRTDRGWETLAADGVLVATPARRPHLPAISSAVPGGVTATLGARLLGAMDPGLRSEVGGLTVGVDGMVRLLLRDGVTVFYGPPGEAEAKAQALEALLLWERQERARVEQIDVSVPGAPTAKVVGGTLAIP